MQTRRLRAGILVAAMLGISIDTAFAADPIGNWFTETGAATVRIASCGAELCGTIIALKEPSDSGNRPAEDRQEQSPTLPKRSRPMIGVQIVFGMKPGGNPNQWNGQVYNAEDGKTYSGSITLQGASQLKLEGCALGGLICKSQIWTRAS